MDKTLFVTEIRREEASFRVRTYERASSVMVSNPPRFRVTTIHKWVPNLEPQSAAKFVDELGCGELTHWEVCQQLDKTGKLDYDDELAYFEPNEQGEGFVEVKFTEQMTGETIYGLENGVEIVHRKGTFDSPDSFKLMP